MTGVSYRVADVTGETHEGSSMGYCQLAHSLARGGSHLATNTDRLLDCPGDLFGPKVVNSLSGRLVGQASMVPQGSNRDPDLSSSHANALTTVE